MDKSLYDCKDLVDRLSEEQDVQFDARIAAVADILEARFMHHITRLRHEMHCNTAAMSSSVERSNNQHKQRYNTLDRRLARLEDRFVG